MVKSWRILNFNFKQKEDSTDYKLQHNLIFKPVFENP